MSRVPLALSVLLCLASWAGAQGTAEPTHVGNLDLRQVTVGVPSKFASTVKTPLRVNLPPGFQVQIFYKGILSKPRFMAFGPDSVLYVANQTGNRVIALPDRDHDGVADTAVVAASNLPGVHDVKFFQGALYATTSTQVIRLTDGDGDLVHEARSVFIDSIAARAAHPTGGHTTRTVLFDSAGGNVFLSIGSSCNACRDEGRGVIERYDLSGRNRRLWATGARNAVGLALHPVTGRLWANNNGNDNQGDNVPPEWIDLVRDGGFYGWPFVYGSGTWNDFTVSDYRSILPLTAADSVKARSLVAPAALIQAHSAPLGLEFATPAFPPPFGDGLFSALHGSWNRSVPTGYKVVFLALSGPQDTVVDSVSDFLTGLTTDSVRNAEWARPAGVLADLRGNLYVSSDADSQFILRISPVGPVGAVRPPKPPAVSRTGPRTWRIDGGGGAGLWSVSVHDLSGRIVARQEAEGPSAEWTAPAGLRGVFQLSVRDRRGSATARVVGLLD